MIGTQLGPYTITDRIGAGGMATVYRAHQPSMDRYVAIKIIHANILQDATLRDRFEREARLIARLEHPHLLPVYDFNGTHSPPYIVMRYLEGGTLKQVLEAGLPPHGEMLYMLRQVAAALDYAHRQGVVHRDLKPSNIMIDREGNAFIADFGIARAGDAENLTSTGVLVGTPGYMAPEQARGDAEVDARADIYALGVTVFEMLAGRPPYEGESSLGVLMAHVQEPVPRIRELAPALPAAVEEIVQTALAKDRSERYPTATGLVRALGAALEVEVAGQPSQIQAVTETIAVERLEAFVAAARATNGGNGAAAEHAPDTPPDQQRQMTAVYVDVTELAETLYESGAETEAVREVMEALWQRFAAIAEQGGGVLQSRTDEVGVLLWGLERTSEDDAERAIRAALDMQAATRAAVQARAGAAWRPTGEAPLPFLAGVTTGPVLLERDPHTDSQSARGATITLAGRLKDSAPPGGVLVAHDSYTQVRGVFDFQPLPAIRVRGRRGMLEVYVALRARPRAFRLQARGIEGVETRMIGREVELRVLQEALTLTIEDGETQVVTVVGEAGVGKSRLLFEFSNWIDLLDERLWFFQARAMQPSMLQPYALTRDLFSDRFQILDSDSLDVVHRKLVEGVAGFLGAGSTEQAELIAHLVGFDFSSYPAVAAALQDADGFRERALAQLGALFVTAARNSPVVIQIEDIHWADDRSLDLINNLVRENTELPLFVICMARPSLFERRPQWGEGQRFHARIQLEPLSLLSSRRLVKELLKRADSVPAALRDLIIDRGEGNPFYIEELVKALIDDGVIVKGEEAWTIDDSRLSSVRIPPTLTGVLQSRLDTLAPDLQQVLQRAAVVGRVFWDTAVVALSPPGGQTPGAVAAMLDELRRREMIFLREESNFGGAHEYVFRHAILRDVTYETIVPRQRRAYHRRVAGWLLEAGGERAGELTLLVAEHYELAREPALAAGQLAVAGRAAVARGALDEALSTFERALALLQGEQHVGDRLRVQVEIGEIHSFRGDLRTAEAVLEPVVAEARERGERLTLARALGRLGRCCMWRGDYDACQAHLAEALELTRELGDRPALVFILRQMGNITFTVGGDAAATKAYLTESLELARELGDRASAGSALNSLGILAGCTGDQDGRLACFEEALAIGRETGDRGSTCMYLGNIADAQAKLGNFEAAQRAADEALELARQGGFGALIQGSLLVQALLLLKQGRAAEARPHLEEALELALESGSETDQIDLLGCFALHEAQTGERETALEWLGLLLSHPAASFMTRLEAKQLVAEVRGELPPGAVEAALERGATLELRAVIARCVPAGSAT